MKAFLTIANWESFQSYKDRRPPWIRLHKALLDNYEFQSMSANARALLPMIWLIASEDQDPKSGCVRGSYESVAFRLRSNTKDVKAGIDEIVKAGFVTVQNQLTSEAKQQITPNKQSGYETVTPETETEAETEAETETETDSCESAFHNCWDKYPRKAGNKRKAYESFKKTVWKKKKRINIFLEKMEQYTLSVDNPKYLKHAETFFKNWEDLEVSMSIVSKPKKKTTVRHNLDLLKSIDLELDNDNKRIQAGNSDNVGIRVIGESGKRNNTDLERVTNRLGV
ncbi:hypothetical protein OAL04_04225 [Nitrospinae bacterium]|nr:hypothetical protein [Nitrospinota bacterium]